MPTYQYCDLSLESDIPIPELARLEPSKERLFFGLEKPREQLEDTAWDNYWLDADGSVVISHVNKDASHWLRFPNLADFQISIDRRNIYCHPIPGIPKETIRHLLLDQVLPRCLALGKNLVLHASGVLLNEGILIILGASGVGKSTLAGYLHNSGGHILADDVILIKTEDPKQLHVVPSYCGLRLWNDSFQVLFSSSQAIKPFTHYSKKKRVQFNSDGIFEPDKGYPALAVICLSTANPGIDDRVCLQPLTRRDAFIKILSQTFQLDSNNLEERIPRLQSIGHLVSQLPAYQLNMLQEYDYLPLVRQQILDVLFGNIVANDDSRQSQ